MANNESFKPVIDRGDITRPPHTKEFTKSLAGVAKKIMGDDDLNKGFDSPVKNQFGALLQDPSIIQDRQGMFRRALFGSEGGDIGPKLDTFEDIDDSRRGEFDEALKTFKESDSLADELEPLLKKLGATFTAKDLERFRAGEGYRETKRLVRNPSRAEITDLHIESSGKVITNYNRRNEGENSIVQYPMDSDTRGATCALPGKFSVLAKSIEGRESSCISEQTWDDGLKKHIGRLHPEFLGLLPLDGVELVEGEHTLWGRYTPDIETLHIEYPAGLVQQPKGRSRGESRTFIPRIATKIRRRLGTNSEKQEAIEKSTVEVEDISDSHINLSLRENPQFQGMRRTLDYLVEKFTKNMYTDGIEGFNHVYHDRDGDFRNYVIDELKLMSQMRKGLEGVKGLVQFPEFSSESGRLKLEGMLHPLFTLNDRDSAVANTVYADQGHRIHCIGGATGGGKTSVLSGVALNVILAQYGLPVFGNGEQQEMSVFDNIFFYTGVEGKGNDVSTHQYELKSLRNMLNKATPNSLVLIDEPAKGAQADEAAENLSNAVNGFHRIGCTTMLTTHLPQVEEHIQGMREGVNYHVTRDKMFSLQYGVSDGSYARDLAEQEGMGPQDINKMLDWRGF